MEETLLDTILDTIVTIAFILPILTFMIPWRIGWRLWVLFAATVFFVVVLSPEDHDKGLGYFFGLVILYVYGIVVAALFGIRFLLYAHWNKRNPPKKQIESSKFYIFDAAVNAYIGVGLSSIPLLVFAHVFAGYAHGYLIHIGIGIAALFFAKLMSASTIIKRLSFMKYNGAFVLAFSFSIALVSLAGLFYPQIVIRNAEHIAQGNPYCIALNTSNFDHTDTEDLTFFTMTKSSDNHAFLLVEQGNEFLPYHWSYRRMEFVSGVSSSSIGCRPQKNFAKSVLQSYPKPENVEVYFKNVFLTIPQIYTPTFSTNYISISAVAPDFHAVEKQKYVIYPSVEFINRDWISGLTERNLEKNETLFTGTLDDLKKATALFNIYHIYDQNHQIITVIHCYHSGRNINTACQHRFYRNNAMYSFDHAIDLIPRAIEMEDTLFTLFQSFGLENVKTTEKTAD